MILGINASRGRSGGARAHLIGILSEGDPADQGIREVHVWSYGALLDALPDRPWLVKHQAPALERSLPWQVLWERFSLPGAGYVSVLAIGIIVAVVTAVVSRITVYRTLSGHE